MRPVRNDIFHDPKIVSGKRSKPSDEMEFCKLLTTFNGDTH